MTNQRTWLAVACVVIGALQAWDSRALTAEPFVQVMIAIAIMLVPIALVATRQTHVHLGAAAGAGVLLALARLVSAVHLPELVLAAAFPGAIALINHLRGLAERQAQTPRA